MGNRTALTAFLSRSPDHLKGYCNETCADERWAEFTGKQVALAQFAECPGVKLQFPSRLWCNSPCSASLWSRLAFCGGRLLPATFFSIQFNDGLSILLGSRRSIPQSWKAGCCHWRCS